MESGQTYTSCVLSSEAVWAAYQCQTQLSEAQECHAFVYRIGGGRATHDEDSS
jgi:hypothetical protein